MQSSFLGRGSGSAANLLAKSSSTFGNTKSFIFGSENRSNQGAPPDASQAQASLHKSLNPDEACSRGSIQQGDFCKRLAVQIINTSVHCMICTCMDLLHISGKISRLAVKCRMNISMLPGVC